MARDPSQYEIDMASETRRNQALDGIVEGFSDMEKSKLGAAKTKRQRALQGLQLSAKFQDMGFNVKPEQINQALDAKEPEKPGMIRRATDAMGITDEAPVEKQQSITDLFSQRTPEYEQKQRDVQSQRELQGYQLQEQKRKSKEAEMPFEATRAGQKFKSQADYKQGVQEQAEREKSIVPGFGYASNPKDAKAVKDSMVEADSASKLIDEIMTLGTDTNMLDPRDIGSRQIIGSKMKILAGKLRIPLTGPGAMTEGEFDRLIDTMGDPRTFFSTEGIEKAKLASLKQTLKDSVTGKMRLAGMGAEHINAYGRGLSPEDMQGQGVMASGDQPVADIEIQKVVQQYTPEQKMSRLQELKAKQQRSQVVQQYTPEQQMGRLQELKAKQQRSQVGGI